MNVESATAALKRIVVRHPGVRLLLLHGSRARDDAHTQSDWDVGYLADGDIDPLALTADVADALATDRVDVVDLARASALLRFEAARDGRRVHERSPGDHDAYALEATRFWCDVEGVVRRAGAAVLAELAP